MARYRILVEDTAHLTAPDHTEYGSYASEAEAITAARGFVDDQLAKLYRSGMSPDMLLAAYFDSGRDPVVIGPGYAPRVDFSAWDYAASRAAALCAEKETSL